MKTSLASRSARRHVICLAVAVLASVIATPATAGSAATPNEVLLARPLAPTNISLFHTAFYPKGRPMSPAPGPAPDQSQVATMLDNYLAVEFPNDPSSRSAATAVFNDPTAESKIPNPSLRAALAALYGTIAQPAIDHILHAKAADNQDAVTDVVFSSLGPNIYGETFVDGSGHSEIRVDSDQAADDPFLFTPILAHEALHQDQADSSYEEATNDSFETLVYLHQLNRHPSLVRSTELDRFLNTLTMARLNSGTGSQLGLFATNGGKKLLPESSKNYRSFWESYEDPILTATPGNALLGEYLARIHTTGGACTASSFNRSLLNCIDRQGDAGLNAADLVNAARAMKLNVHVERSRSVSISYRKHAFKGQLASSAGSCTVRQRVSVFKQRPGRDHKVGDDKTNSRGAYSVKAKHATGKFYATASRSTIAGTGVCLPAKSKPKRIR